MRTFTKIAGIALAALFVFWTIMRIATHGDFSGVTVIVLAGIGTAVVCWYRKAREDGKFAK